jgi:hypothetical protein
MSESINGVDGRADWQERAEDRYIWGGGVPLIEGPERMVKIKLPLPCFRLFDILLEVSWIDYDGLFALHFDDTTALLIDLPLRKWPDTDCNPHVP